MKQIGDEIMISIGATHTLIEIEQNTTTQQRIKKLNKNRVSVMPRSFTLWLCAPLIYKHSKLAVSVAN